MPRERPTTPVKKHAGVRVVAFGAVGRAGDTCYVVGNPGGAVVREAVTDVPYAHYLNDESVDGDHLVQMLMQPRWIIGL